MTPEWIRNPMQALKGQIPVDFVGQVEINIFKGGVTNVNIKQLFKEKQEG